MQICRTPSAVNDLRGGAICGVPDGSNLAPPMTAGQVAESAARQSARRA